MNDDSRQCLNCNRLIIDETAMTEANPTYLILDVMAQTESKTCFICNAQNNVHRLSIQNKV